MEEEEGEKEGEEKGEQEGEEKEEEGWGERIRRGEEVQSPLEVDYLPACEEAC